MANEPSNLKAFHGKMAAAGFEMVGHRSEKSPYEDSNSILARALAERGVLAYKHTHWQCFFVPFPKEIQRHILERKQVPAAAMEFAVKMEEIASQLALEHEKPDWHEYVTTVPTRLQSSGSRMGIHLRILHFEIVQKAGSHGYLAN